MISRVLRPKGYVLATILVLLGVALFGVGAMVTVAEVADQSTLDLMVDGIFVEIGYTVNSAMIKGLVELDGLNQVITNKRMETSTPGVFAAGDITDGPYKQAVISAGEGATAALSAYSYLNGGAKAGVDWSAHT